MPKLSPNARKGVTLALVMALAAFLAPQEGRRLVSYQDIVGKWTICEGITANVVPGQVVTDEECDEMTAAEAETSLNVVFDAIPSATSQPASRLIALADLEYNIGAGAFNRSQVPVLMNAGKYRAACNDLLSFDQVKDHRDPSTGKWIYRHVAGLTKRRAREYTLCIKGL